MLKADISLGTIINQRFSYHSQNSLLKFKRASLVLIFVHFICNFNSGRILTTVTDNKGITDTKYALLSGHVKQHVLSRRPKIRVRHDAGLGDAASSTCRGPSEAHVVLQGGEPVLVKCDPVPSVEVDPCSGLDCVTDNAILTDMPLWNVVDFKGLLGVGVCATGKPETIWLIIILKLFSIAIIFGRFELLPSDLFNIVGI